MKYYSCDGGTVMIGNKNFRVHIPNGYGDGDFSVKIVKTAEQREAFNKEYDNWDYKGSVEGDEINVYSYDCLRGEELDDKRNILYTLSGRYGVYSNRGKITLVTWG